MFSEEDEHGIVEHMDISKRRLMRALTLIMENAGRHIPVFIAPLKQTIRQVYVLAIHKEIFIEQPYLVESLMTHHAESSTDDLYALGAAPRQVTHIIMAEATALREAGTQTAHLVEGG